MELLKIKEAAEIAEVFDRIMRTARGKQAIRGKSRASGAPRDVSTDTGAEFKCEFSDMLKMHGISQRFKESVNSLAVVDAAIRTLKAMITKEMVDTGSDS